MRSEAPQYQKNMGTRSFQIQIWGPQRWPTTTKLGVPSNYCYTKFLSKCTIEAPELHLVPFWPPLDPGVGYRVSNLIK